MVIRSNSMDDYIRIPNNGVLDVRYSMTMMLWFFPMDGTNGPLVIYEGEAGRGNFHGPHLWENTYRTLVSCLVWTGVH